MSSTIGWLFLLGVIALFAAATAFRRKGTAPEEVEHEPEDLSALGLTPPRPRTSSDGAARHPDKATESNEPSASSARQAPSATPISSGPFASDDSPLWTNGQHKSASLLIGSLAAYLNGTVAVLRAADDAYHIDALSSSRSRASALIQRANSRLDKIPPDGGLTELDGSARAELGYHRDPESAVGQAVACTLAPPPHRRVLLVADRPPGAEPFSAHSAGVITRYADLLTVLSDLAPDEPADADGTNFVEPEPPQDVDDAPDTEKSHQPEMIEADALNDPSEDASEATASPIGDPPVPRLRILDEEILGAERSNRTLCFGMVTLADAEDVLQKDATAVAAASAHLAERLTGCDFVRRVEPFGDLLVGVFINGALSASMDDQLSALCKEEPVLRAGIAQAIGIGGHVRSEKVRAAATEALERAYDEELFVVFAPSAEETK